MDDTPDKLRRNVVVLAAAILAIALFNLSFRTTGTLLGFAEVGNVSPFKVWLALTATLLYVLMRYHHSDETKAERAYVAESFCELRRVALIGRVVTAVRRYFLRGAPVALFDDFADFLDNDIERHMTRDGRAKELDDLKIGTADPNPRESWWEGRVGVSFHAIWSGGSYGAQRRQPPGVHLVTTRPAACQHGSDAAGRDRIAGRRGYCPALRHGGARSDDLLLQAGLLFPVLEPHEHLAPNP